MALFTYSIMPSSVPSTGQSQSEYSAFSAARLEPGSPQVLGRGNERREEERKGSRERERERKGRGKEEGRKGERKEATQEKSGAAMQCNLECTGTMSRMSPTEGPVALHKCPESQTSD